MKRSKQLLHKIVLGAGTISAIALFILPLHAYAFDIWPSATACPNAASSALCSSKDSTTDPITGPNGIIINIAGLMALIAGVAAVIVIILAGLSYVTSGGDPAKAKTAKDTIIYAAVGLVAIVLAHSILVFIINKIG